MIKNTIEAPLWPSVDTIPAQYPWLSADETCEVAVLGGGVTAAMCALRFAEAGIDTVLVSASPVGFGGSACSSGMMTLASGDSLVSLVEEIGAERAMSAAELLLGSLKNLEDFCASTEDGCGFHRKDSLLYTSEEACTSKLRREYSLRLHNGLDVELLNADTASEQFTFPMEAGVYTKNAAAQVDPYRLTHAAVRAAKEKGARIYENTTASAINQSAQDDITLECSTHHRIQARYVIVAAGLETHRYCGGLTQAGTTYLLATEPVEEFRESALAERQAMLDLLVQGGWMSQEAADDVPDNLQTIVEAMHAMLTDAPSLLLQAALVDGVGEARAQNQPGTSTQYPNWRIPLADEHLKVVPTQEVFKSPRVQALAKIMNRINQ